MYVKLENMFMVSAIFYAHDCVNAIRGNGNCRCIYCWKHWETL